MRYRSGEPDYANLWFKLQWVRLGGRVIGGVGAVAVFVIWGILNLVGGQDVGQTFLNILAFALPIAFIVLCVMAVWRTLFPKRLSAKYIEPNHNVRRDRIEPRF
ncbi:hypothetical protein [Acidisoma sp. C75]